MNRIDVFAARSGPESHVNAAQDTERARVQPRSHHGEKKPVVPAVEQVSRDRFDQKGRGDSGVGGSFPPRAGRVGQQAVDCHAARDQDQQESRESRCPEFGHRPKVG
jgi:hypothetical protein